MGQSTTISLTGTSKLARPIYCIFLNLCFNPLLIIAKTSKVYIMGIQKYASLIVLIAFISLGNAAVINVKDDPTTAEPTPDPTPDPTTAEPTTAAPTTEKPTTAAPTTEKPTTEAPKTSELTTAGPTGSTEAPTGSTEAPTGSTEAPTGSTSGASNFGGLSMFLLSSTAYLLVFKLI